MNKWVSEFMRVSQDMYNVGSALTHIAYGVEVAVHNGDREEAAELIERYDEVMAEMQEYEAELKLLIKERCHA